MPHVRFGRSLSLALVLALVIAAVLPSLAVAQQGQPPAAPSNLRAEPITLEGRPATRLSWTDNANNEAGFRVVDQNRPQEYPAGPAPGTGSTVSITVPVASGCFRVYAYNEFGRSPLSEMACTPTAAPAPTPIQPTPTPTPTPTPQPVRPQPTPTRTPFETSPLPGLENLPGDLPRGQLPVVTTPPFEISPEEARQETQFWCRVGTTVPLAFVPHASIPAWLSRTLVGVEVVAGILDPCGYIP